MINSETWELNSGFVNEPESKLKPESWMVDEVTWNAKSGEDKYGFQNSVLPGLEISDKDKIR